MSAIPITVTGTIATEPAARTLPSGRACASFRLAVNHWRVDRSTGEFLDDGTSWFGIDCYGDLAGNSSMSLRKGTAIIVTGSLRNREWETEERSGIAPTVVADHIGPDLRYGTAHYQRAKGQERPASQSKKGATDTGETEVGGWGELSSTVADAGGSDPEAAGVDPGYRGADESGATSASFGTDETSSGESAGVDSEAVGDTTESDAEDAAIAAKTATAAAPF